MSLYTIPPIICFRFPLYGKDKQCKAAQQRAVRSGYSIVPAIALAALVLLVTAGVVGAEDMWESYSDIAPACVEYYPSPTVFQKDGTWYLISGGGAGNFDGYHWTGSTWQTDTAIVSGLGDVGKAATPTVFQKDGTWYLISGERAGIFIGYHWTGSTWQTDTAIVSGLGGVPGWSAPTVFQEGSNMWLISGDWVGAFHGFYWTGSTWQTDTAIVSGLGTWGSDSTPTVFQKDGTWYLIVGRWYGTFRGSYWTGSTWQTDTAIVSGLGDIGYDSTPTVFQKDGTWYLITGASYCAFRGFRMSGGGNNTTILLKDCSDNLVQNAEVVIYDETNNEYLQKWTVDEDGIITRAYSGTPTLLLMVKTFDGVFVQDVHIKPEGGVTNITIPIHYNLKVYPKDQYGVPLFDVFAGLAEYTPLDPQAFWGYSMTDRRYVPVTNFSGFAMCDIIAEKGGYGDYNVTALNWTSKNALVKDYRHTATLIKE